MVKQMLQKGKGWENYGRYLLRRDQKIPMPNEILSLSQTSLELLHTLSLSLFDLLISLEGLSSTIFCQLFQVQWNLVFLVYYNKKSFSQIRKRKNLA